MLLAVLFSRCPIRSASISLTVEQSDSVAAQRSNLILRSRAPHGVSKDGSMHGRCLGPLKTGPKCRRGSNQPASYVVPLPHHFEIEAFDQLGPLVLGILNGG